MKPVSELINECTSIHEIRQVLNYANWTRPSGYERRRFLKLAKIKIKELNTIT